MKGVVRWTTGPSSGWPGMAALGFARSRIAQHKDDPPDRADRRSQQGGGEKAGLNRAPLDEAFLLVRNDFECTNHALLARP